MDSSYTNSFGQFGDSVTSSNGGMVSGNTNGVGSIVSGSNDAAPVMPSGDDIVLAPSSNGATKKRRWPVAVAIVLFIVAIGAGVGAWIASQPWGSGGGVSKTDTKTELSKMIGYILHQDDSLRDFEESDFDSELPTQMLYFGSSEDAQNYFTNATRLAQEYNDGIENEENLDIVIRNVADNQEKILQFLNLYLITPTPSVESVIDLLSYEDDNVAANEYIVNNYGQMLSLDADSANNYVGYMALSLIAEAELFSKYINMECAEDSDDVVFADCLVEGVSSEEAINTYNSYLENSINANTILSMAASTVVNNCESLWNYSEGGEQ